MTQLDIPQISFARYLELLKRRRWQVIPITILGLVIGTGVAFLIPRYFVARTNFTFEGGMLDAPIGGNIQDDPMRAVVDKAKLFIPATVAEVLEKLAWPEAMDLDLNRRRTFIRAVTERVTVEDPQGSWRGQEIVSLRITYRDIDGPRAAEFANELRDIFISSQRQRLEQKAQRALNGIQADVEEATLALENIALDIREHRSTHQIDPQLDLLGEGSQARGLRDEVRDETSKLTQLRAALVVTERTLSSNRLHKNNGTVRPRIAVKTDDPLAAALRNRQILALAQLQLLQQRLANLKPAHPDYQLFKRGVDQAEASLALDPTLGQTQIRTEPNPAFAVLNLEIDRLENLKITLTEAVETQEFVVVAFEKRLEDLPEIWRQYDEYQARYQEAITAKALRVDQENVLLERFNLLKNEDSFAILSRATVPPVPTEPSIIVVSILGALIGLALAIALILVIDLLQTTYKTVDDVERGLSIPVLGGMAHLQTDEERMRLSSQRRALVLGASVFLFLTVVVVTIFHVAPTRLPAGVYQVLDMLLGSG